MIDSEPTFTFLRPYVPDLLGAVAKLGQISAYYDANGHYVRVQPAGLGIFTDNAGTLDPIAIADQFQDYGLPVGTVVPSNFKLFRRCPGGMTQPAVDGSSTLPRRRQPDNPGPAAQRLHTVTDVPPGP